MGQKILEWLSANKKLVIAFFIGILIGAFLAGIARAQARTVSWTAVTTYTDGSAIEAGLTVSYSVWYQDNVTGAITQVANRTSNTSAGFDDAGMVKGRKYDFFGQAFLSNGAASDNSARYAWTRPLGALAPMGGWTIQ